MAELYRSKSLMGICLGFAKVIHRVDRWILAEPVKLGACSRVRAGSPPPGPPVEKLISGLDIQTIARVGRRRDDTGDERDRAG